MNTITKPLRQLLSRKLWPVALLLVGALVAVPLALAKDPQPAPAATAAATQKPSTDEGVAATFGPAAEPATTGAGDATTTKRRRTLGAKKDPFEPAPLPKKKKVKAKKSAKTDEPAKQQETAKSDDSTSSGSGSS